MTDENENSIPEPIENEAQAASELPPGASAHEHSAPSAPERRLVVSPKQPSQTESFNWVMMIVIVVVGAVLVVIILALLPPATGRIFSNIVAGI